MLLKIASLISLILLSNLSFSGDDPFAAPSDAVNDTVFFQNLPNAMLCPNEVLKAFPHQQSKIQNFLTFAQKDASQCFVDLQGGVPLDGGQTMCSCFKSKEWNSFVESNSFSKERLKEYEDLYNEAIEERMFDHLKGQFLNISVRTMQIDNFLKDGEVGPEELAEMSSCQHNSFAEKINDARESCEKSINRTRGLSSIEKAKRASALKGKLEKYFGSSEVSKIKESFDKQVKSHEFNRPSSNEKGIKSCLGYKAYLRFKMPTGDVSKLTDDFGMRYEFKGHTYESYKRNVNYQKNSTALLDGSISKDEWFKYMYRTDESLINDTAEHPDFGWGVYDDWSLGRSYKNRIRDAKERNRINSSVPILDFLKYANEEDGKILFDKFNEVQKNPEAKTDLLKKMIKLQNKSCEQTVKAEAISAMLCPVSKRPKYSKELFNNDLTPAIVKKFKSKYGKKGDQIAKVVMAQFGTNDYCHEDPATSQVVVNPKADQDATLVEKSLMPLSRTVSELEMQQKGVDSDYTNFSKTFCPLVNECLKDGLMTECNNPEYIKHKVMKKLAESNEQIKKINKEILDRENSKIADFEKTKDGLTKLLDKKPLPNWKDALSKVGDKDDYLKNDLESYLFYNSAKIGKATEGMSEEEKNAFFIKALKVRANKAIKEANNIIETSKSKNSMNDRFREIVGEEESKNYKMLTDFFSIETSDLEAVSEKAPQKTIANSEVPKGLKSLFPEDGTGDSDSWFFDYQINGTPEDQKNLVTYRDTVGDSDPGVNTIPYTRRSTAPKVVISQPDIPLPVATPSPITSEPVDRAPSSGDLSPKAKVSTAPQFKGAPPVTTQDTADPSPSVATNSNLGKSSPVDSLNNNNAIDDKIRDQKRRNADLEDQIKRKQQSDLDNLRDEVGIEKQKLKDLKNGAKHITPEAVATNSNIGKSVPSLPGSQVAPSGVSADSRSSEGGGVDNSSNTGWIHGEGVKPGSKNGVESITANDKKGGASANAKSGATGVTSKNRGPAGPDKIKTSSNFVDDRIFFEIHMESDEDVWREKNYNSKYAMFAHQVRIIGKVFKTIEVKSNDDNTHSYILRTYDFIFKDGIHRSGKDREKWYKDVILKVKNSKVQWQEDVYKKISQNVVLSETEYIDAEKGEAYRRMAIDANTLRHIIEKNEQELIERFHVKE